jgi:hypothetical protein
MIKDLQDSINKISLTKAGRCGLINSVEVLKRGVFYVGYMWSNFQFKKVTLPISLFS